MRLLPGCPFNASTWPELLRMVLLARAVAHAPKKRSVAIIVSGSGDTGFQSPHPEITCSKRPNAVLAVSFRVVSYW